MLINQKNEPIVEQVLSVYDDLDRSTLNGVLFALLAHLKLEAVRTNSTKHGGRQIIVRAET